MRNDFGNRPYKSRFPYKAGPKKAGSKKQGYLDKEDESVAMRIKKKRTKKDPKKAKAERDLSYGKWGKRSKDWKKA